MWDVGDRDAWLVFWRVRFGVWAFGSLLSLSKAI